MMKRLFATTILAILAVTTGAAQEKRMTDNPGLEHADLLKLVGEYNTLSKFKLNPTDAGQHAKGTSKFTSILDGRFLLEEGDSEQFGQPFKTRKLYGFNNGAKRYESSWIYTASTAQMTLSGTSSDGGKTIQLVGGFEEGNGKRSDFAVVIKRISDDKFVVDFTLKAPGGGNGPSLETTYTRK